MEKLKKQENLKVAVQVDGVPFILGGDGILFESVDDSTALLYIKSKDSDKEIKIKIEREK